MVKVKFLFIQELPANAFAGARFVSLFLRARSLPTRECERELAKALSSWRKSLPRELQIEGVQSWSSGNIWILLLLAVSYRLECIFYRTVRRKYQAENNSLCDWASSRLWRTMFELDTIVGRVITHEAVALLPIVLYDSPNHQ